MKTTPTTGGEALPEPLEGVSSLSVVAQVIPYCATVRLEWASVRAAHNSKPGPLCSIADAQAAMDAMRVERDEALKDCAGWLRERNSAVKVCYERAEECEALHAEIATLKALQPVAVERVMELAEVCEIAYSNWMDAMANLKPGCATTVTFKEAYFTAREALRTELTKGQA